MMKRMVNRIAAIVLISLLLGSPVRAQNQTRVVGLRLAPNNAEALIRSGLTPVTRIDYGSFVWLVLDAGDLSERTSDTLSPASVPDPYHLDLGGQRFDPLLAKPTFPPGWQEVQRTASPNLHLIQFHGPIKAAWLADLQNAGLEIVQYLHPFTYVVWGSAQALERAGAQPAVRWEGAFHPAYAVQPRWRALESAPQLVRILIFRAAGAEGVAAHLEGLGGDILGLDSGVDPAFDVATLFLPGDRFQEAAAIPGVYSLQLVPQDGGDRSEMSSQINVGNYDADNRTFPGYLAWLSSVGLSGDGVIIANVDSGIDQTHPDLAGRILTCTGSTCGGSAFSNHGTHTAGIMAGDGSSGIVDAQGFLRGLGVAPGANLIEQIYYPTYTHPLGVYWLMYESHTNGAVISGNSWGPSAFPQGYDADTRLVDIGVRDTDPGASGNQPLSYILSIMNGWGGTSTQGSPDEAKNIFTIGSTWMRESDGDQNLNINNLSPNSAHGPALDGRNIPHMVAPGYYVDSTLSGGGYGLRGGTSMASPQVTGAAALFFESYRNRFGMDPSPALVKAAFLAVAHDLAGNRDADNVLLGHPFDSRQGWGRMDAAAVLRPLMNVSYYDQPVVLHNTGDTWTTNLNFSESVSYLHVMLVWTDAPGHGMGGTTPAWNNDLDLSLSNGSGTYLGNNFGPDGLSITGGAPDGMNNTEGIFLPPSPAGTYTITVTAANITSDGVPGSGDSTDQDFALVIYSNAGVSVYELSFPVIFK